jgi:hypothetical protein
VNIEISSFVSFQQNAKITKLTKGLDICRWGTAMVTHKIHLWVQMLNWRKSSYSNKAFPSRGWSTLIPGMAVEVLGSELFTEQKSGKIFCSQRVSLLLCIWVTWYMKPQFSCGMKSGWLMQVNEFLLPFALSGI